MVRGSAALPIVASLRAGAGKAGPMGAPVRTGTSRGRPPSLQARVESLRRQLADCEGKGEDAHFPILVISRYLSSLP